MSQRSFNWLSMSWPPHKADALSAPRDVSQSIVIQGFSGLTSRSGRRHKVGDAGGLFFILMLGLGLSLGLLLMPSGVAQAQALAQTGAAPAATTSNTAASGTATTDAASNAAQAIETELLKLDEVNAGQLLFKTDAAGQYRRSVMLDSNAHFMINGMLARVSLSQTFQNTSADWVEGVYVFPLPEDAAVDRMRIRIGERVIEGRIRERQEAKRIYQQAKNSGRKASLVEQERPNLFTNSVANIGPGETVEVAIEYLQVVQYEQGEFQLRMPMTMTPRFFPGQTLNQDESVALQVESGMGWARGTDEVPDAQRVSPYVVPANTSVDADGQSQMLNPIRISGELNMGMPLERVQSLYHEIVLNRQQDQYDFELLAQRVVMDHDFVLRWRPVVGQEPQAAVFSQAVDGEDYAMLMIVPPQAQGLNLALPKEMIFIIDTSGSMGGTSIKQAKFSLQYALDQLKPGDRFNIVEFNSDTRVLFTQPVVATPENIATATEFVEKLRADGGTNMRPALEAALWQDTDEAYLRQVIFITDGAVGNEEALFQLIHNDLGNGRLFTVGIGSAPNSFFMRKAAEFGRGSFTYIANVSETHTRMRELFTKLESPLSSDIEVHWPAGAVVESYPERIPDLYAGEPVLVAARLDMLGGDITVTGRTADHAWSRKLSVPMVGEHDGVATLWGRRKISHLLDEKAAGTDETLVRDQVLETALRHQILSPYTSFVAVEEKISRPENAALKSKPVPNAQPKGQASQPYAYPQTATRSAWSLMIGGLLLMLSLLRLWHSRRGLAYVASL